MNEPYFFDILFAVLSVFMPRKLKERIKVLGKDFYDKLESDMDLDTLPDDFHRLKAVTGKSSGAEVAKLK